VDGDAMTSAVPTCWLAWLTAWLLRCCGYNFNGPFLGDSRQLIFGSRLVEVVGDQLSELLDRRLGDLT
jgi:hypothetical protein